MLVGSLSLLATPWLTGFYSKDTIIELAYGQFSLSGIYAYILGSITAGITAFYSFRLLCLVFLTVPNGNKNDYNNSHEANLSVIIPLLILSLFSIFFGYIFSDLFIGMGTNFFGNSLYIKPNNISLIDTEFSINSIIKLLPVILSITCAILAFFLYHYNYNFIIDLSSNKHGQKIYKFLNGKYLIDIIYNKFIIYNFLIMGYFISKYLDRGFIEMVGPFGLSTNFYSFSTKLSKLDTGIITTYAIYFTIASLSLICFVFANLLFANLLLVEIRLVIIYFITILIILS
jgi:NADH-ubiquinone oxidoreductase chain 5